jgi:hypothetical protein
MAKHLSRRRVLTHKDFMCFGGLQQTKPARKRADKLPAKADVSRARWSDKTPAQIDRAVGAELYACPDGAADSSPEGSSENQSREGAKVPR